MLLKIIGILAVIVAVTAGVLVKKFREDEVNGYYEAAKNIIKEKSLDNALKNPYLNEVRNDICPTKIMIYLKTKGSKNGKYVFDPSDTVYIGRDKEHNHICINEAMVSRKHCRIFSENNMIILENFHTKNGVAVKRGLFFINIPSDGRILLKNGDVIKVGTTLIKCTVFALDMRTM